MNKEEIKRLFDAGAIGYDTQRRKLIPCFDEFYGAAVSWASAGKDDPRILDLGAGTGLFAGLLKRKYPRASVTLIDVSERMLEAARARFDGDPLVQYVAADYTEYEFTGVYDLVISALSIHHLPHSDKRSLFRTVHGLLAEGGVFVNADQAAGASPFFDERYRERWLRAIRQSGLAEEEIEASLARRKLDRNASVSDQIEWLREAGFADADCVYKSEDFAVFFARK